MNVAVIGAGYVGLITGAGLASNGNEICLVDIDTRKVAMINQAKSPLHEEGLEPLLQNSAGNTLRASTDIDEAVANADIIFLCVPTYCQDNGAIDLTHIVQATTAVGKAFQRRQGYPGVRQRSRDEHGRE